MQVDLFDLFKAFDCLQNDILLQKLSRIPSGL
nr:unnamed protein product [Callosobruchus analis]